MSAVQIRAFAWRKENNAMLTIKENWWKRSVPALAAALLLAALPTLADAKPAPILTSVTVENGEVTLSWTYNESPDSYRWRGKQNDEGWAEWGGGIQGNVVRAGGTARSYTIRSYPEDGIESGNTYTFEIRAVFIESSGSAELTGWSSSMSVTVSDDE